MKNIGGWLTSSYCAVYSFFDYCGGWGGEVNNILCKNEKKETSPVTYFLKLHKVISLGNCKKHHTNEKLNYKFKLETSFK